MEEGDLFAPPSTAPVHLRTGRRGRARYRGRAVRVGVDGYSHPQPSTTELAPPPLAPSMAPRDFVLLSQQVTMAGLMPGEAGAAGAKDCLLVSAGAAASCGAGGEGAPTDPLALPQAGSPTASVGSSVPNTSAGSAPRALFQPEDPSLAGTPALASGAAAVSALEVLASTLEGPPPLLPADAVSDTLARAVLKSSLVPSAAFPLEGNAAAPAGVFPPLPPLAPLALGAPAERAELRPLHAGDLGITSSSSLDGKTGLPFVIKASGTFAARKIPTGKGALDICAGPVLAATAFQSPPLLPQEKAGAASVTRLLDTLYSGTSDGSELSPAAAAASTTMLPHSVLPIPPPEADATWHAVAGDRRSASAYLMVAFTQHSGSGAISASNVVPRLLPLGAVALDLAGLMPCHAAFDVAVPAEPSLNIPSRLAWVHLATVPVSVVTDANVLRRTLRCSYDDIPVERSGSRVCVVIPPALTARGIGGVRLRLSGTQPTDSRTWERVMDSSPSSESKVFYEVAALRMYTRGQKTEAGAVPTLMPSLTRLAATLLRAPASATSVAAAAALVAASGSPLLLMQLAEAVLKCGRGTSDSTVSALASLRAAVSATLPLHMRAALRALAALSPDYYARTCVGGGGKPKAKPVAALPAAAELVHSAAPSDASEGDASPAAAVPEPSSTAVDVDGIGALVLPPGGTAPPCPPVFSGVSKPEWSTWTRTPLLFSSSDREKRWRLSPTGDVAAPPDGSMCTIHGSAGFSRGVTTVVFEVASGSENDCIGWIEVPYEGENGNESPSWFFFPRQGKVSRNDALLTHPLVNASLQDRFAIYVTTTYDASTGAISFGTVGARSVGVAFMVRPGRTLFPAFCAGYNANAVCRLVSVTSSDPAPVLSTSLDIDALVRAKEAAMGARPEYNSDDEDEGGGGDSRPAGGAEAAAELTVGRDTAAAAVDNSNDAPAVGAVPETPAPVDFATSVATEPVVPLQTLLAVLQGNPTLLSDLQGDGALSSAVVAQRLTEFAWQLCSSPAALAEAVRASGVDAAPKRRGSDASGSDEEDESEDEEASVSTPSLRVVERDDDGFVGDGDSEAAGAADTQGSGAQPTAEESDVLAGLASAEAPAPSPSSPLEAVAALLGACATMARVRDPGLAALVGDAPAAAADCTADPLSDLCYAARLQSQAIPAAAVFVLQPSPALMAGLAGVVSAAASQLAAAEADAADAAGALYHALVLVIANLRQAARCKLGLQDVFGSADTSTAAAVGQEGSDDEAALAALLRRGSALTHTLMAVLSMPKQALAPYPGIEAAAAAAMSALSSLLLSGVEAAEVSSSASKVGGGGAAPRRDANTVLLKLLLDAAGGTANTTGGTEFKQLVDALLPSLPGRLQALVASLRRGTDAAPPTDFPVSSILRLLTAGNPSPALSVSATGVLAAYQDAVFAGLRGALQAADKEWCSARAAALVNAASAARKGGKGAATSAAPLPPLIPPAWWSIASGSDSCGECGASSSCSHTAVGPACRAWLAAASAAVAAFAGFFTEASTPSTGNSTLTRLQVRFLQLLEVSAADLPAVVVALLPQLQAAVGAIAGSSAAEAPLVEAARVAVAAAAARVTGGAPVTLHEAALAEVSTVLAPPAASETALVSLKEHLEAAVSAAAAGSGAVAPPSASALLLGWFASVFPVPRLQRGKATFPEPEYATLVALAHATGAGTELLAAAHVLAAAAAGVEGAPASPPPPSPLLKAVWQRVLVVRGSLRRLAAAGTGGGSSEAAAESDDAATADAAGAAGDKDKQSLPSLSDATKLAALFPLRAQPATVAAAAAEILAQAEVLLAAPPFVGASAVTAADAPSVPAGPPKRSGREMSTLADTAPLLPRPPPLQRTASARGDEDDELLLGGASAAPVTDGGEPDAPGAASAAGAFASSDAAFAYISRNIAELRAAKSTSNSTFSVDGGSAHTGIDGLTPAAAAALSLGTWVLRHGAFLPHKLIAEVAAVRAARVRTRIAALGVAVEVLAPPAPASARAAAAAPLSAGLARALALRQEAVRCVEAPAPVAEAAKGKPVNSAPSFELTLSAPLSGATPLAPSAFVLTDGLPAPLRLALAAKQLALLALFASDVKTAADSPETAAPRPAVLLPLAMHPADAITCRTLLKTTVAGGSEAAGTLSVSETAAALSSHVVRLVCDVAVAASASAGTGAGAGSCGDCNGVAGCLHGSASLQALVESATAAASASPAAAASWRPWDLLQVKHALRRGAGGGAGSGLCLRRLAASAAAGLAALETLLANAPVPDTDPQCRGLWPVEKSAALALAVQRRGTLPSDFGSTPLAALEAYVKVAALWVVVRSMLDRSRSSDDGSSNDSKDAAKPTESAERNDSSGEAPSAADTEDESTSQHSVSGAEEAEDDDQVAGESAGEEGSEGGGSESDTASGSSESEAAAPAASLPFSKRKLIRRPLTGPVNIFDEVGVAEAYLLAGAFRVSPTPEEEAAAAGAGVPGGWSSGLSEPAKGGATDLLVSVRLRDDAHREHSLTLNVARGAIGTHSCDVCDESITGQVVGSCIKCDVDVCASCLRSRQSSMASIVNAFKKTGGRPWLAASPGDFSHLDTSLVNIHTLPTVPLPAGACGSKAGSSTRARLLPSLLDLAYYWGVVAVADAAVQGTPSAVDSKGAATNAAARVLGTVIPVVASRLPALLAAATAPAAGSDACVCAARIASCAELETVLTRVMTLSSSPLVVGYLTSNTGVLGALLSLGLGLGETAQPLALATTRATTVCRLLALRILRACALYLVPHEVAAALPAGAIKGGTNELLGLLLRACAPVPGAAPSSDAAADAEAIASETIALVRLLASLSVWHSGMEAAAGEVVAQVAASLTSGGPALAASQVQAFIGAMHVIGAFSEPLRVGGRVVTVDAAPPGASDTGATGPGSSTSAAAAAPAPRFTLAASPAAAAGVVATLPWGSTGTVVALPPGRGWALVALNSDVVTHGANGFLPVAAPGALLRVDLAGLRSVSAVPPSPNAVRLTPALASDLACILTATSVAGGHSQAALTALPALGALPPAVLLSTVRLLATSAAITLCGSQKTIGAAQALLAPLLTLATQDCRDAGYTSTASAAAVARAAWAELLMLKDAEAGAQTPEVLPASAVGLSVAVPPLPMHAVAVVLGEAKVPVPPPTLHYAAMVTVAAGKTMSLLATVGVSLSAEGPQLKVQGLRWVAGLVPTAAAAPEVEATAAPTSTASPAVWCTPEADLSPPVSAALLCARTGAAARLTLPLSVLAAASVAILGLPLGWMGQQNSTAGAAAGPLVAVPAVYSTGPAAWKAGDAVKTTSNAGTTDEEAEEAPLPSASTDTAAVPPPRAALDLPRSPWGTLDRTTSAPVALPPSAQGDAIRERPRATPSSSSGSSGSDDAASAGEGGGDDDAPAPSNAAAAQRSPNEVGYYDDLNYFDEEEVKSGWGGAALAAASAARPAKSSSGSEEDSFEDEEDEDGSSSDGSAGSARSYSTSSSSSVHSNESNVFSSSEEEEDDDDNQDALAGLAGPAPPAAQTLVILQADQPIFAGAAERPGAKGATEAAKALMPPAPLPASQPLPLVPPSPAVAQVLAPVAPLPPVARELATDRMVQASRWHTGVTRAVFRIVKWGRQAKERWNYNTGARAVGLSPIPAVTGRLGDASTVAVMPVEGEIHGDDWSVPLPPDLKIGPGSVIDFRVDPWAATVAIYINGALVCTYGLTHSHHYKDIDTRLFPVISMAAVGDEIELVATEPPGWAFPAPGVKPEAPLLAAPEGARNSAHNPPPGSYEVYEAPVHSAAAESGSPSRKPAAKSSGAGPAGEGELITAPKGKGARKSATLPWGRRVRLLKDNTAGTYFTAEPPARIQHDAAAVAAVVGAWATSVGLPVPASPEGLGSWIPGLGSSASTAAAATAVALPNHLPVSGDLLPCPNFLPVLTTAAAAGVSTITVLPPSNAKPKRPVYPPPDAPSYRVGDMRYVDVAGGFQMVQPTARLVRRLGAGTQRVGDGEEEEEEDEADVSGSEDEEEDIDEEDEEDEGSITLSRSGSGGSEEEEQEEGEDGDEDGSGGWDESGDESGSGHSSQSSNSASDASGGRAGGGQRRGNQLHTSPPGWWASRADAAPGAAGDAGGVQLLMAPAQWPAAASSSSAPSTSPVAFQYLGARAGQAVPKGSLVVRLPPPSSTTPYVTTAVVDIPLPAAAAACLGRDATFTASVALVEPAGSSEPALSSQECSGGSVTVKLLWADARTLPEQPHILAPFPRAGNDLIDLQLDGKSWTKTSLKLGAADSSDSEVGKPAELRLPVRGCPTIRVAFTPHVTRPGSRPLYVALVLPTVAVTGGCGSSGTSSGIVAPPVASRPSLPLEAYLPAVVPKASVPTPMAGKSAVTFTPPAATSASPTRVFFGPAAVAPLYVDWVAANAAAAERFTVDPVAMAGSATGAGGRVGSVALSGVAWIDALTAAVLAAPPHQGLGEDLSAREPVQPAAAAAAAAAVTPMGRSRIPFIRYSGVSAPVEVDEAVWVSARHAIPLGVAPPPGTAAAAAVAAPGASAPAVLAAILDNTCLVRTTAAARKAIAALLSTAVRAAASAALGATSTSPGGNVSTAVTPAEAPAAVNIAKAVMLLLRQLCDAEATVYGALQAAGGKAAPAGSGEALSRPPVSNASPSPGHLAAVSALPWLWEADGTTAAANTTGVPGGLASEAPASLSDLVGLCDQLLGGTLSSGETTRSAEAQLPVSGPSILAELVDAVEGVVLSASNQQVSAASSSSRWSLFLLAWAHRWLATAPPASETVANGQWHRLQRLLASPLALEAAVALLKPHIYTPPVSAGAAPRLRRGLPAGASRLLGLLAAALVAAPRPPPSAGSAEASSGPSALVAAEAGVWPRVVASVYGLRLSFAAEVRRGVRVEEAAAATGEVQRRKVRASNGQNRRSCARKAWRETTAEALTRVPQLVRRLLSLAAALEGWLTLLPASTALPGQVTFHALPSDSGDGNARWLPTVTDLAGCTDLAPALAAPPAAPLLPSQDETEPSIDIVDNVWALAFEKGLWETRLLMAAALRRALLTPNPPPTLLQGLPLPVQIEVASRLLLAPVVETPHPLPAAWLTAPSAPPSASSSSLACPLWAQLVRHDAASSVTLQLNPLCRLPPHLALAVYRQNKPASDEQQQQPFTLFDVFGAGTAAAWLPAQLPTNSDASGDAAVSLVKHNVNAWTLAPLVCVNASAVYLAVVHTDAPPPGAAGTGADDEDAGAYEGPFWGFHAAVKFHFPDGVRFSVASRAARAFLRSGGFATALAAVPPATAPLLLAAGDSLADATRQAAFRAAEASGTKPNPYRKTDDAAKWHWMAPHASQPTGRRAPPHTAAVNDDTYFLEASRNGMQAAPVLAAGMLTLDPSCLPREALARDAAVPDDAMLALGARLRLLLLRMLDGATVLLLPVLAAVSSRLPPALSHRCTAGSGVTGAPAEAAALALPDLAFAMPFSTKLGLLCSVTRLTESPVNTYEPTLEVELDNIKASEALAAPPPAVLAAGSEAATSLTGVPDPAAVAAAAAALSSSGVMFAQLWSALGSEQTNRFRQLYSRGQSQAFRVRYTGEKGEDAGGLFRDAMGLVATSVHSRGLGLLVPCAAEAGGGEAAGDGLCLPRLTPALHPAYNAVASSMLEFLGGLLGLSLRTQAALPFAFPPLLWRALAGAPSADAAAPASTSATPEGADDLAAVAPALASELSVVLGAAAIATADAGGDASSPAALASFTAAVGERCFTVPVSFCHHFGGPGGTPSSTGAKPLGGKTEMSAASSGFELIPGGSDIRVTPSNAAAYVAAVRHHVLQVAWAPHFAAIRRGLSRVLPLPLLSIFTASELEVAATGAAVVDIEVMKRHTVYKGAYKAKGERHAVIRRYWRVLASLTPAQRQGWVRFCWGRSRLPDASRPWKHVVSDLPDATAGHLPKAHVCFFEVELPVAYDTDEVMRSKLLAAILAGAQGVSEF